MRNDLPIVYLARHGETEWSLSGRHTGHTDLPLTRHGEENATRLGQALAGKVFDHVLCSPLQRARRTCDLAGFGAQAVIDPDLTEWDYGDYEGLTTAEIETKRPGWELFRDGCPGGESTQQIVARANRMVRRLRGLGGRILAFSSGHITRVLAGCWIESPEVAPGRGFMLDTASLSALSYEHNLARPAIRFWNDCHHLAPQPTDNPQQK